MASYKNLRELGFYYIMGVYVYLEFVFGIFYAGTDIIRLLSNTFSWILA
ncbi:MAG: hypothetical protein FWG65_01715 [Turicibacter sp.]|nr:hypothetical protein [Turicibacter sp.]